MWVPEAGTCRGVKHRASPCSHQAVLAGFLEAFKVGASPPRGGAAGKGCPDGAGAAPSQVSAAPLPLGEKDKPPA